MIIGLIGDSHGETGAVWPAVCRAREAGARLVVLMGDVGWWPGRALAEFFDPLQRALVDVGVACAALDGNHDYPGDGTDRNGYRAWTAPEPDLAAGALVRLARGARFVLDDCAFVVCGGAVSIDKSLRRTVGPPDRCSWWPDEAVTEADVGAVRAACAVEGAVDVLLTHDAVELPPGFELAGDQEYRTSVAIQRHHMYAIREAAAPRLHVHGHFHDHRIYTRALGDGRMVRTIGLAADGNAGCLHLLDTADVVPPLGARAAEAETE